MKNAKVLEEYAVSTLDEDGGIVDGAEGYSYSVDQIEGEILELWKTREDGFHFVYSERLELGYWVHPNLIKVIE